MAAHPGQAGAGQPGHEPVGTCGTAARDTGGLAGERPEAGHEEMRASTTRALKHLSGIR
jgi:hypothetical protein